MSVKTVGRRKNNYNLVLFSVHTILQVRIDVIAIAAENF
jgi:hypothetical protein